MTTRRRHFKSNENAFLFSSGILYDHCVTQESEECENSDSFTFPGFDFLSSVFCSTKNIPRLRVALMFEGDRTKQDFPFTVLVYFDREIKYRFSFMRLILSCPSEP